MPAQTLEPVRTWPDTVPDPTRTLGWDVLLWASRYLLQPDGPDAGRPWRFTDVGTIRRLEIIYSAAGGVIEAVTRSPRALEGGPITDPLSWS